jgi:hypothetical protein
MTPHITLTSGCKKLVDVQHGDAQVANTLKQRRSSPVAPAASKEQSLPGLASLVLHCFAKANLRVRLQLELHGL